MSSRPPHAARPGRGGRFAVALLAVLASGSAARADVTLPRVLSDGMVVQRDTPVRVWGWADPGETVTVTLDRQKATATAGADRRWRVELPALKAGGPHELTVAGKNTRTVRDVLVGEVWFCSGQSNMALGVVKSLDADREIKQSDYPNIRLLTVPHREAKEPAADAGVEWRACGPRTVSYFSATAYYFGREVHRKLGVPVGLVVAAVNGTRIEPWTPARGVRAVEALAGVDKAEDGPLYNGMVHPFTPLAVRGVIWYQGEGNVGDGMRYAHRMAALVGGWRGAWGLGDFPFYYVQLTPLNWGGKPKEQHAELWEAQAAALRVPNTGMAVTNDVGNVGDAHPRNKQEVGRRLALLARANTYGEKDLVFSGPVYRSAAAAGGTLRLKFDHAHGGLASRDGKPLTWFTVAGADGRFVPADAAVDGDEVVVSSPAVPKPVAARFAWHQAAEPNLVNKAGLPAGAFRTDRRE